LNASPENVRSTSGWWITGVLFVVFAALVAMRVHLVEQKIGSYIACSGCFNSHVVLEDLLVLSALASFLLMASATPTRLLTRIPLLCCGLILLVYAADLVVFKLYTSRLLMTDAALFIAEGGAVWDQLSSGLGGPWMSLTLFAGIVCLFSLLIWMPASRTRLFRLTMSFVLGMSLVTNAYFESAPYVNNWAVENVFLANMSTTSRNRYSNEVEHQVLATSVPKMSWSSETTAIRDVNVIMVIVESWSAWHSRLWGGFENWTPELDQSAQKGLRFENFHSIGFSTDKGLVGILGGQQIWAPFLHWFETPPFHSMWGIGDSLPRAFSQGGYHTAFLTSGPLTLYRKGEWMSDIGFDYVEGNEHPFYESLPKYAFGSASDNALYQRALEWIRSTPEQQSGPWFLVLETVTTHQPYRDPDSGERSLELAMKYADREFGGYLDQLESGGFFDNGMLVVVSDHRSMTPMSRRELDLWGDAAHSLVPAFVIGAGFEPGSVANAVYSQSDLTPSFEWWAAGEVTLKPFEAVMFDPEFETSKCAFHQRMDRRGLVEASCNEGRGQIILDGDNTRFIGSTNLGPEIQRKALEVIARQRLEAWQRHQAITQ
jgi:hypothetical protein